MGVLRRAATAGLVLLLAVPAPAQDEDGGGMIQRFLQSKLSGAGRDVQIRGFQGLLSGQARLGQLTIADDEGVWLTLNDAVLDWSRAALLRGRLSVEELSAGELILERLPAASGADAPVDTPKAEASGFSLPELPVSVHIDRLAIERAELGEAVIGQSAVLGLEGSVVLDGGEGTVDLETRRLDRDGDHILIQGSFANESRELSLGLSVQEEAGGLVSTLMKLPGSPSLDLELSGAGPLSDFNANVGLRTDGEDRLAGTLQLRGDGAGGTGFEAEVGGDVTPLLPAEFHAFFGDDIRLVTSGSRAGDGAFALDQLSLTARSLDLQGAARLDADGAPAFFDLSLQIEDTTGVPVRLPTGTPVRLGRAELTAKFDASQGDDLDLTGVVQDLDLDTADIALIGLAGSGTIQSAAGVAVATDLTFQVNGIEMADAGMAEAIGRDLSGGVGISWQRGGALNLSDIRLVGEDFGLSAVGDVRIEDRSVKLSGDGSIRAADLSRFSTLAGRPLTGRTEAKISGEGDLLGGIFAVTLDLEGDGLSIGQETADRLLTEPVTLAAALRRDTGGTTLDLFELRSRAVTADASGSVGGGTSDIGFEASLSDVGLVMPGHEGALTLSGQAREASPGDWRTGLDLTGPYGLTGNVDGRIDPGNGDVTLSLSLPDIAPLVPGHSGPVTIDGTAKEGDVGRWDVNLDVGGPYELTSNVQGLVAAGETDLTLDLDLPDIAPLAPGHSGQVTLSGTAAETGSGWTFSLDGRAPYDAAVTLDGSIGDGPNRIVFSAGLPDVAPLAPQLSGQLRVDGTATDAGAGLWQVDVNAEGPLDAVATIDGIAGGGQSDLALDISVPDLAPLVPQLAGALTAKGTAAEAGDGRWNVDFNLNGPQNTTVGLTGAVGGTGTDVAVDVAVPDIAPFAPGFTGAVAARATAAQQEGGAWALDLDATGPYRSTVTAGGTYGGGASNLSVQAAMADIGDLVPALSGQISIDGRAVEAQGGTWNVDLNAAGPYRSTVRASGAVGAANTAVDLAVSIPSISPFAPGLTGGVEANGRVAQTANGFDVNLTTNGPEGAASTISGSVASDFATMSLRANGTAPLGFANRFIEPNVVNGTAQFDFTINGAPSLQAVSGSATVRGATFSMPTMQQNLQDIGVRLTMNGENLQIDASANGPAGGGLSAAGSFQLGTMVADIEARLNEFVVTDPLLFRTSLNGRINFAGPVTGGGAISGRIGVGRTEIRVPDSGLGFGGTIPEITHINEPAAVFATRVRAGLIEQEQRAARESSSGGSGAVFGLDVVINAPSQIFIRGRGLDAEMGGSMRVTGTTAAPRPVGRIEVIRGRLDILGRRLDMDQGTISLAGGLVPYLDLQASSSREDFQFVALITGPVDAPEFELTSVPALPGDEVLAYFLFGKGLNDLSPLQAVQLASAVATLTGVSSGPGLLGGLRQGLGLDDLDLATGDSGQTEVRAGRYISDNVYTEFVADADGDTEIDVNIDISKSLTIRGSTNSRGDSSIGIYFERDY